MCLPPVGRLQGRQEPLQTATPHFLKELESAKTHQVSEPFLPLPVAEGRSAVSSFSWPLRSEDLCFVSLPRPKSGRRMSLLGYVARAFDVCLSHSVLGGQSCKHWGVVSPGQTRSVGRATCRQASGEVSFASPLGWLAI